jgi:hypothetical protein
MKKVCALIVLWLIASVPCMAHVIPYELDAPPAGENLFWKYLGTGYEHIIPSGFDHILFILCVFFLNTSIRKIILQATMFTLAHSITLGLAMYDVIKPSAAVVEPLIALSIVFLAMENVLTNKVKPWRLVMVFLFGLVHGMGFASGLIAKLQEAGLPRSRFVVPLVAFNVGVELGQLSIILFMFFVVGRTMSARWWYRKRVVIPSSLAIAAVALYWTVERTFFPS